MAKSYRADEAAPGKVLVAVTPSDATVLDGVRRLYIGTGGTLAVVDNEGNTVNFGTVPTGTELNISVTKVLATGTTATNIVAYK